jgi:hypothetical protein
MAIAFGEQQAIVDKDTYQAALGLLADLLPGIAFREEMIAFQRSLTPLGGSSDP